MLLRKPLKCGIVPHPLEYEDLRQFYILITRMCNANCPYCIESKVNTGGFMTEETFINCIKKAKSLDLRTLDLHGGEPTIHPNVVHFAKLAKEWGFRVHMFTNGICEDVLRQLDGIVDEIRFSYEPGREYMFKNQADWKSRIKLYIMATEESYPTEQSLMAVVNRSLDLGMDVKVRTLNPINPYAYKHQFVHYLHRKLLELPKEDIFCDGNKAAYRMDHGVIVRLGNMQLNPGHLKFSFDPDGNLHDHFDHSDKRLIVPDPQIELLKDKFEPLRQELINI